MFTSFSFKIKRIQGRYVKGRMTKRQTLDHDSLDMLFTSVKMQHHASPAHMIVGIARFLKLDFDVHIHHAFETSIFPYFVHNDQRNRQQSEPCKHRIGRSEEHTSEL